MIQTKFKKKTQVGILKRKRNLLLKYILRFFCFSHIKKREVKKHNKINFFKILIKSKYFLVKTILTIINVENKFDTILII